MVQWEEQTQLVGLGQLWALWNMGFILNIYLKFENQKEDGLNLDNWKLWWREQSEQSLEENMIWGLCVGWAVWGRSLGEESICEGVWRGQTVEVLGQDVGFHQQAMRRRRKYLGQEINIQFSSLSAY